MVGTSLRTLIRIELGQPGIPNWRRSNLQRHRHSPCLRHDLLHSGHHRRSERVRKISPPTGIRSPDRPISIPTEISRPHSQYTTLQSLWLNHVCTNPGRQIAVATALCLVSLNICGPSKRNVLNVIIPARRSFRWFTEFLDTSCNSGLTL